MSFQCTVSVLDNKYALSIHSNAPRNFQLEVQLEVERKSQFSYNEATFFVRLLQQFTGFTLEKSENIQPPAEWAACDGLKGIEKVCLASHLSMYIRVSVFFFFFFFFVRNYMMDLFYIYIGWPLGPDGTAEDLITKDSFYY